MEARYARKTTTPQATGHRSSVWGARERGPSSARIGLPPLAQARPKAQGLQANRPCSTSGRRHPAKLRHSQCSFYAVFIVGFTLGILGAALTQPPDHRIARILGRASFPTLGIDSGMQFPAEGCSGKRVPVWTGIPGRSSRPKQKPRLAREPGLKAQLMQLMLSANSPSAMAVRALPYPRLRTRL